VKYKRPKEGSLFLSAEGTAFHQVDKIKLLRFNKRKLQVGRMALVALEFYFH
jgi:hypothetical protein